MKHEEQALPPQRSLGQRLRRHRLRLGLSQEALAEAIRVSVRSIRRWEQDLAIPQEVSRERLCRLFGIEPQYLLGSLPSEEAPQLDTANPIWYVPLSRNACFTGREEILETLHTLLAPEQPVASIQALALSGLGGIGKTHVAMEYAYRYAQEYRAVFWLAAETAESLVMSLQRIADRLQLSERQAAEQSQMITAVQEWFATHPGWLLIGDDVEDLDLLRAVLPPASPQGALLLTTRHQALGTLAKPLERRP